MKKIFKLLNNNKIQLLLVVFSFFLIIISVTRALYLAQIFSFDFHYSTAKLVSEGVNRVKGNSDLGIMLITHYTRILRYIKPDFVHVFSAGKIVEAGGPELADKLEEKGYAEYTTA